MNEKQINIFISNRQVEMDNITNFWETCKLLKDRLKPETFDNLQSVISSDMAQIQKSIDSHVKLLPDAPY